MIGKRKKNSIKGKRKGLCLFLIITYLLGGKRQDNNSRRHSTSINFVKNKNIIKTGFSFLFKNLLLFLIKNVIIFLFLNKI